MEKHLQELADLPLPAFIVARMEGRVKGPIQERDIVRGRCLLYSKQERDRFGTLSTKKCPTLGNCMRCFHAGPMGESCGDCMGYRYVMVVVYRDDDDRKGRNIVDAEHLQDMARLSLRKATFPDGDKTATWKQPPVAVLRQTDIERICWKNQKKQAEDHRKLLEKKLFANSDDPPQDLPFT